MAADRIPSRIVLPFGFRITIKQVSPKDPLLHVADDEYLDGAWYADERMIVLNKALPPRKRRYLFTHELAHALADFQHEMFLTNKAKPTGDN